MSIALIIRRYTKFDVLFTLLYLMIECIFYFDLR